MRSHSSYTTNGSLFLCLTHLLLFLLPWSATSWMRTTLADRLMGKRPTHLMMSAEAAQPSPSSSSSASSSTKQFQRDMIEFMEQPVDSLAGDSASSQLVPPEQDDVADLVRCIVKAADGRKAEDVVALRVSHVSTLTTFLVILSGNSRPQNQAIAAAITKGVAEAYGLTPGGTGVPEGSPESGWMVLDYGSVMVHIMTPKSRLYYNVEGQWRDKGAEAMDLSDILIPNSAVLGDAAPASSSGDDALRAEDDPFWS